MRHKDRHRHRAQDPARRAAELLAFRRTPREFVGLGLIAYATLIYPILGLASGHHLTELPMFGVTPGPVTIFTLGCILLTTKPVTWRILTIPLLWSLIGGTAALLLGIWQDWALLLSGAAVLLFLKTTKTAAGSDLRDIARVQPLALTAGFQGRNENGFALDQRALCGTRL
jgi:hypothetical protein